MVPLAGCSAPSVNLATPEPIKVDINVRLDVYQHDAEDTAAAEETAATPTPSDPVASTPESRRRNRMADIQNFKNSRLIGEDRHGLLAVLDEPPGDYGEYVRRIVAEENEDRMGLMQEMAETQRRPLPEIQEEQAAIWRTRSFKNEWIEVPGEDGAYRWEPKGE